VNHTESESSAAHGDAPRLDSVSHVVSPRSPEPHASRVPWGWIAVGALGALLAWSVVSAVFHTLFFLVKGALVIGLVAMVLVALGRRR
jgi:hypothetical protein